LPHFGDAVAATASRQLAASAFDRDGDAERREVWLTVAAPEIRD
jgi:hypothetical protein